MGIHAFAPREFQGSRNSGSTAPSKGLGTLMQQNYVLGPGGHMCGLLALLPLCGRQSSVPCCPMFQPSPLWALPLWHGFGSFPGLWGEVAMMDGDVKMPDSVDVKPVCAFRIMLIYVRSPGPKIRECKYYNMDQETLPFVCCSKV